MRLIRRVARGGAFYSNERFVRYRLDLGPDGRLSDLGFRVVLS